MNNINNNILIKYSEYLLMTDLEMWFKILTLNKQFFPYAIYNLTRFKDSIDDDLLKLVVAAPNHPQCYY